MQEYFDGTEESEEEHCVEIKAVYQGVRARNAPTVQKNTSQNHEQGENEIAHKITTMKKNKIIWKKKKRAQVRHAKYNELESTVSNCSYCNHVKELKCNQK